MEDYGKIPPQAIDIEEGLLGIVIRDGYDVLDKVSIFLMPEMFYKAGNQKIFEKAMILSREGKNIDLLTITNILKDSNELNEIGGVVYLSGLTLKVSSSANIEYYGRIVQQKYILREIIRNSTEMGNMAFEEGIDFADILEYNYQFLEQMHEGIYSGLMSLSFGAIIKKSLEEYSVREKLGKEGIVSGIPTPILNLTKVTGGWNNSDLVIIAGRPGMGKTAMALSIVKKAALDKKWINVYSLEMSSTRLVDRMLCGDADINSEKFRDGMLNKAEFDLINLSAKSMMDMRILIDPTPVVKMDYILSRSRVNKKKGHCDLVVIDYLQLIENSSMAENRNREQEVSYISRKAKLIAKELNVPVIMLAQLNRQCELRGKDKRPILSDLRESGAIEQDADIVMFLYRAERYGIKQEEDGTSTAGKGECIIAKQRNGRTGVVFFGYNTDLTRITDYETETEFDEKNGVINNLDSDVFIEQHNDKPF